MLLFVGMFLRVHMFLHQSYVIYLVLFIVPFFFWLQSAVIEDWVKLKPAGKYGLIPFFRKGVNSGNVQLAGVYHLEGRRILVVNKNEMSKFHPLWQCLFALSEIVHLYLPQLSIKTRYAWVNAINRFLNEVPAYAVQVIPVAL